MKKTIFDGRLFVEALRRLRTIGIVHAAVCTVISVMPLLLLSVIDEYDFDLPYTTIAMLYVSMYVFAPLYSLLTFRFLMTRSASDFHHGLPQTRPCLFLSFAAAAAAMYTAVVSLVAVAGPAFLALRYGISELPIADTLSWTFGLWLGGLATMMAAALAMALSGRVFSAICAWVMIAFVPRLLLAVLVNGTLQVASVIPADQLGWFLGLPNIVTFGNPANSLGVEWIYTAALVLLYGGLALFAFCRRPSEAAGQSAASRGMQTVYRLVVGFVFCLPAIYSLYTMFTGVAEYGMLFGEAGVVEVVMYYVTALMAYFLFELITTRKPKNLLRAMPWLGVLVALNVVVIAGMTAFTNMAWSYHPEASEVQEITVVSVKPYDYYGLDNPKYEDIHGTTFDGKGKEVLCKGLKRGIQKASSNPYFSYLYNDDYGEAGYWDENDEYVYPSGTPMTVTAAFLQDGRTRYRQFTLTAAEYDTLVELTTKKGA
ncbi:MAG: hypothetical protein IJU16_01960 [Clostridia bacterium]|nr:hypothetical protein [Clostridia bacterium]